MGWVGLWGRGARSVETERKGRRGRIERTRRGEDDEERRMRRGREGDVATRTGETAGSVLLSESCVDRCVARRGSLLRLGHAQALLLAGPRLHLGWPYGLSFRIRIRGQPLLSSSYGRLVTPPCTLGSASSSSSRLASPARLLVHPRATTLRSVARTHRTKHMLLIPKIRVEDHIPARDWCQLLVLTRCTLHSSPDSTPPLLCLRLGRWRPISVRSSHTRIW